MSPPTYVFKNWIEAASNAKNLLDRGEIDHDEYGKILPRAKKEQSELGQAPAQPTNSAPAQPQPTLDQMNGRAPPVQSLPTLEEVQRYINELMGPRPAY
jgi:hypothetical protein